MLRERSDSETLMLKTFANHSHFTRMIGFFASFCRITECPHSVKVLASYLRGSAWSHIPENHYDEPSDPQQLVLIFRAFASTQKVQPYINHAWQKV